MSRSRRVAPRAPRAAAAQTVTPSAAGPLTPPAPPRGAGNIVDFALRGVNAETAGEPFALHEVESCEVQVVAGLKYRCVVSVEQGDAAAQLSIVVWDRFGTLTLLDYRRVDDGAPSESSGESSLPPIPGGWRDLDPNDPHAVEAARFATQTIASTANVAYTLRKVVRARVQVVAGLNLDLVMTLSLPNDAQEQHHARVYDRFGTLSLTEHHNCAVDSTGC